MMTSVAHAASWYNQGPYWWSPAAYVTMEAHANICGLGCCLKSYLCPRSPESWPQLSAAPQPVEAMVWVWESWQGPFPVTAWFSSIDASGEDAGSWTLGIWSCSSEHMDNRNRLAFFFFHFFTFFFFLVWWISWEDWEVSTIQYEPHSPHQYTPALDA